MMPLKLPAAIAKLLETGGQSKPQTGLPQQHPFLQIPGDPALCSCGEHPAAGGLRAGRQVPAPEFGSSRAEGPTLWAHHCKSR